MDFRPIPSHFFHILFGGVEISDFVSKKIAQNKNIILEGKNAEQIKLIVKIEDYKEKVKKGNISHSELKDLCKKYNKQVNIYVSST